MVKRMKVAAFVIIAFALCEGAGALTTWIGGFHS